MANIIDIIGKYKDDFSAKFNNSIKSAEKSTKGLTDKLSGLTGILPAQFQGVTSQIDDMSGAIMKAGSSLGPYGVPAAGAIAVGVGLFTNGIIIEKEFSTLSKTMGNVTESMRVQSKVISGTFNLSLQEVAKTTEKLSNLFKITDATGLTILQEGLSKTTADSKEFIDTFSEFSPVFKDMGLNAKESSALVANLLNSGMGQKGSDAIKEFGIKFGEMGKSQQAALKGIGINYIDLSNKVKSGSITSIDAMKIVSDKISDLGSNSASAKTAISAMFSGPGEDLGVVFQEILAKININLDEMPNKIGKTTTALEGLSNQWEIFKGILSGGKDGQNFISETINSMINSLTKFTELFTDLFEGANWTEKFKAIGALLLKFVMGPLNVVFLGLETLGNAFNIDWIKKLGGVNIDIVTNKDIEKIKAGSGNESEAQKAARLSGIKADASKEKTRVMLAELQAFRDRQVANKKNTITSGNINKLSTQKLAETRDIKSLVINIDSVVKEQNITTNEDPIKLAKLVSKALTTIIADTKLAY